MIFPGLLDSFERINFGAIARMMSDIMSYGRVVVYASVATTFLCYYMWLNTLGDEETECEMSELVTDV